MSHSILGVVGPCAAGKTTLVRELRARGYSVKHIAQEHSYVPTMWQRIARPDILIYLDVSYPITLDRRQLDWTPAEYQEQVRRLHHARQHADIVIDTDHFTPEEILEKLVTWLASRSRDVPDPQ